MSRWVRPPSLLFVHRMWAVPSQRLQPRQVYWTDSCFAALCLPRRLLFILYLLNRSWTLWCPLIPFAYMFCYIAIQTLACSLDSLHRVSMRGSIIAILLRWTCFWRPEPWYNGTNDTGDWWQCKRTTNQLGWVMIGRLLASWCRHENTPSTSGQVHGRPWYVPGVASGHWQHQVRLIVTKQPDFVLLSKDM